MMLPVPPGLRPPAPPSAVPAADPLRVLPELGFHSAPAPTVDVRAAGGDGMRVRAWRPAMGTRVAITAIHRSAGAAQDTIGRAFDELDRLVTIFSRYDRTSALSVLNAEGRLERPPPELVGVLSRALTHHRFSAGAFDPTVAPLVDLFGSGVQAGEPRVPTAGEIAAARELQCAGAVTVSRRRIRLPRRGARLTLDGIAKGFIVDRMATTLERAGITRYLINAGGDLRTGGRKEDGQPWAVAVRDPTGADRPLRVIALAGGSVATSGSYERYSDPGRRFHHVVDGMRGVSPHDCTSATVTAPSAMQADALATAVLVLGWRAGTTLVAAFPGCTCLVVHANGRVAHSRGWKESSA